MLEDLMDAVLGPIKYLILAALSGLIGYGAIKLAWINFMNQDFSNIINF